MNMPAPRHGEICGNTVHILKSYLDTNDIGRVVSNDSGVITERDPDTVRGADVGFYSYKQIPKGPLREGYLRDVVSTCLAVPELRRRKKSSCFLDTAPDID